MGPDSLATERLILRQWRADDRAPFAAINADPVAMERMPSTLDRAESDAMVDRIEARFAADGYGLWVAEHRETGHTMGFVGLWPAQFDAPFTPAVEVGWRLGPEWWGHGYATEAAQTSVADGFDRLGLEEIVSFTSVAHHRSRRVMEKLGMHTDPADDFEHPALAPGHPLRRHVLYRRSAAEHLGDAASTGCS